MQTEFTCGIYEAVFNEIGGPKWFIRANKYVAGIVEVDGLLIKYINPDISLPISDMLEICLLMGKIEQQYKQLQTT